MVNRAARWILAGERYHHRREAADDDQLAINKGEPIGHVRMETGGPRRGEWVSSMFRDASDVNMRIETSGIVEPEGAKTPPGGELQGAAQASRRDCPAASEWSL